MICCTWEMNRSSECKWSRRRLLNVDGLLMKIEDNSSTTFINLRLIVVIIRTDTSCEWLLVKNYSLNNAWYLRAVGVRRPIRSIRSFTFICALINHVTKAVAAENFFELRWKKEYSNKNLRHRIKILFYLHMENWSRIRLYEERRKHTQIISTLIWI